MAYGGVMEVSETAFIMAPTVSFFLAVLLVCLVGVNGAPQFDGSFSQANAQAGGFGGGGFGGGFPQGPQSPGFGFQHPGPPGYGNYPGGFYRPGGFNRGSGGGSISISKSISISRGGGGGAQSSASSNAGSFGK